MKQTSGTPHSPQWKKIAICLFLHFIFFGCRTVPPEPQVHSPVHELNLHTLPTSDLAGTWEHLDENGMYCLRLHQNSNGHYDWQGDRFVTTYLGEGRWRGTWVQTKNDREGGFDLNRTSSGNRADGRWWDTRIKDDHSPPQPGGKFAILQAPCSPPREVNLGSILSTEEKLYSFAKLFTGKAVHG